MFLGLPSIFLLIGWWVHLRVTLLIWVISLSWLACWSHCTRKFPLQCNIAHYVMVRKLGTVRLSLFPSCKKEVISSHLEPKYMKSGMYHDLPDIHLQIQKKINIKQKTNKKKHLELNSYAHSFNSLLPAPRLLLLLLFFLPSLLLRATRCFLKTYSSGSHALEGDLFLKQEAKELCSALESYLCQVWVMEHWLWRFTSSTLMLSSWFSSPPIFKTVLSLNVDSVPQRPMG